MNQGPVKIFVFLLGAIVLAMAIAFGFSRYKHTARLEFGILAGIDGRVEVKASGTRQWLPPIDGDHLLDGTAVRVGTNGSGIIKSDGSQIHLGPDTEVTLEARSNAKSNRELTCRVHSGEIYVKTASPAEPVTITTNYGTVLISPESVVLLSQAAGQKFATMSVPVGFARIVNDGDPREVNVRSGYVLLDRAGQRGIWSENPGFEETFPGKENHEAIVFKWNGAQDDLTGNLLIRNLTTGEMTTHENTKPGTEFTLPSGSYSWVVNAQGFMTTPRRFHIGGHIEQDLKPQAHPATVTTEEAHESSGAEHVTENNPQPAPAEQSPADPEDDRPKDVPAVAAQESSKTVKPPEIPHEAPAKTDVASEEPTEKAKTTMAPVEVQITSPKKESEVSVSNVAELRVTWKTSGEPKSLELEVLGSSQNPSLHFTLAGHRTRQKLKALPPGRYSVRLRAIQESGEPTPWSESFFDVIQTAAGELAPKDVSFMINMPKNPGKIFIQWKKSAAPVYQVRVTSPGAPALIERVKKSHILISQPKAGKATVSVCALDANGHIRGCAEDLSVP